MTNVLPIQTTEFGRATAWLSNVSRLAGSLPIVDYFCQIAPPGQSPTRLTVDTPQIGSFGLELRAESGGLRFSTRASQVGVDCFDEIVTVQLPADAEALGHLLCGVRLDLGSLAGYTVHPIPFKIGLDGTRRSVTCRALAAGTAELPDSYAEGWILENGSLGLLVMRLPDASPMTCLVPARVDRTDRTLMLGSIGPDGGDHQTTNPFLNRPGPARMIEFPVTRYQVYRGGWDEGVALFRSTIQKQMPAEDANLPPAPITYNTFHDFGKSYDRASIERALPTLQTLGFQMIHLDPGWETSWGSTVWDDERMGSPEDLVATCQSHGLQVGLWTSLHTPDTSVHEGHYALGPDKRPYLAEEFGEMKLYGVCPLSGWREQFDANLGRLVRAGVSFINSDFHDWPWSGMSCHSTDHHHPSPPDRCQWALAVNDAFGSLRRLNPALSVELHDHVESGEYRTPVWYLYGREGSYTEKWAYEFMWTTYQDLLDQKLFALYHLRKAEPVPLFLHINMMSDSDRALAFWYVASCVNHIGVGGALKAPEAVRKAYQEAFEVYRRHQIEFTKGEFVGIDETAHLHVHPDRTSGVLLVFNLEDDAVTRDATVPLSATACGLDGFVETADESFAAVSSRVTLTSTIPGKDVRLIPLKFNPR